MEDWFKGIFVSGDKKLWKTIYTKYIRPRLEFRVPAWLLERVQRQVTKLPFNLKYLDYNYRLDAFVIQSLQDRRIREDCIEMYKIQYQLESINFERKIEQNNLRVVNKKIRRELVNNCDFRFNFFPE